MCWAIPERNSDIRNNYWTRTKIKTTEAVNIMNHFAFAGKRALAWIFVEHFETSRFSRFVKCKIIWVRSLVTYFYLKLNGNESLRASILFIEYCWVLTTVPQKFSPTFKSKVWRIKQIFEICGTNITKSENNISYLIWIDTVFNVIFITDKAIGFYGSGNDWGNYHVPCVRYEWVGWCECYVYTDSLPVFLLVCNQSIWFPTWWNVTNGHSLERSLWLPKLTHNRGNLLPMKWCLLF